MGPGVWPSGKMFNFGSLKQLFLHFESTFEQNNYKGLKIGGWPAPLILPSEQGHQHRVLSSHRGPCP